MKIFSVRGDSFAVSILIKAASVLLISILLWSIGAPTFLNFAKAANLTSVSDTLSDSDLSALSNHTVNFTVPNGLLAGQTITVTFPSGFSLGSVAFGDVDFAAGGSDKTLAATCSGTTWGAAVSGQVLTITSCTGTIASSTAVSIEIGTNATFGTAGTNRITNPSSSGSFELSIGGTMADSGTTRVFIIDDVVLTASVDSTFTFTISGVASGSSVNGSPTTTATTTTATALPFGALTPNVSKTLAQNLAVVTNAANGFSVTVIEDQNPTSATGADIDLFSNGATTSTPIAWTTPTNTLNQEWTYGHIGITTEDATLSGVTPDKFGTDLWAGNFNAPLEVFYNNGPSDGVSANQGTTRVGYQIEIDSLQESGNDYTNTLTYVATPTF